MHKSSKEFDWLTLLFPNRFPLYTFFAWFLIPYTLIIIFYIGVVVLVIRSNRLKMQLLVEPTTLTNLTREKETLNGATDTNRKTKK